MLLNSLHNTILCHTKNAHSIAISTKVVYLTSGHSHNILTHELLFRFKIGSPQPPQLNSQQFFDVHSSLCCFCSLKIKLPKISPKSPQKEAFSRILILQNFWLLFTGLSLQKSHLNSCYKF